MNRRDLLSAMALAAAWPVATGARAATAVPTLKFRELYVRGNDLTDKARGLQGAEVEMIGYMAPPLKPEIDFFVLTKLPMSTCPFCETEAQWPDDIVLARAQGSIAVVRYTDLIRVRGRFETGFQTDAETGFVSYVRLMDVRYEKL
ncbi:hypothetical protein ACSBOB_07940 [Mesorhizobium sp. ASY16-5R]|uniref:hypothetical protein n=1 Tax=Mesorhizobium sp. ASY16-5R TaxID=3445772 RepID=UPI003F9FAFD7